MKKRCIIHIPFSINENYAAASQIRPMKMIDAFKNIGYDVEVIKGDAKERKSKIHEVKDNIKKGIKYDFLYSESSTVPTLLTEKNHIPTHPLLDFDFMKFCKKNGIKIGLFYRDIHWRFDQYKDNVSFFKRSVAYIFYYYDLFKYNNILDVMFLPSLEMKKFLPIKFKHKTFELPSGSDYITSKPSKKSLDDKLNIFYSGGLGELYDLELIFKSISENENYTLTICCREAEWEENKKIYEKYMSDRIKIIHKKGKELDDEAVNADLLCLLIKPTPYWEFAMPMKLFYYLSHKKPILAINNTAAGNFVKKNNLGYVIDYKEEDMVSLLNNIFDERDTIKEKFNMDDIFKNNTWEARALEVEKLLLKKEEGEGI